MVILLFSDYTPLSAIYLSKIDIKSVNYYLKNISKLSNKDYIEITYEKLCQNPNFTIKEILDFLKVKKINIDFSNYIKPREVDIDPNIKFLHKYIYKNMKKYFEKFNYSPNI